MTLTKLTTTITPFLVVKGGASAVDFYLSAFGATIMEREEAEGKVNAKLAIGDAVVYIGDEEPEFGNLSPNTIGGTGMRLVLITDDPDSMFDKAIAAGATPICPVTTEDTWKIGKLKDPFGHIWEIGRPLSEE